MSFDIKKSIVKTLVYADIFEYPLTKEQLWQYLISKQRIKRELFEKNLKNSQVSKKGKYYFLKGRNSLIQKRIEREKEANRKMEIAKRVAKVLLLIPTIQLIGLSGTLAMNNSKRNDDIDLFLITSKSVLWSTRFFVLFVLELLGTRRKREEKNVSDTICVNMMITEDALSLGILKKDLYLAHEIIQMKPLVNKSKIYEKFIWENRWVKKYLPNSIRWKNKIFHGISTRSFINVFLRFVLLSLMFEKLARNFQMISIRKHKTTEIVSETLLAFHPFDYRKKILTLYERKIKSTL